MDPCEPQNNPRISLTFFPLFALVAQFVGVHSSVLSQPCRAVVTWDGQVPKGE